MFSYRVRIRDKYWLWGGPEIKVNLNLVQPLFVTIRVDDTGEPVELTQARRDGGKLTEASLGRVQPGGTFTIPISNACGVAANSDAGATSFLTCWIHGLT